MFAPSITQAFETVRIVCDQNGENWNDRVNAIKTVAQLSKGNTDIEYFIAELDSEVVKQCFVTQLKDLRSAVIKDVCSSIAFLAETLQDHFENVGIFILPQLIKLLSNSKEVFSKSASECIRAMLINSNSMNLFNLLVEALSNRSASVRMNCHELLHHYATKNNNLHLLEDKLFVILQKGIEDTSPEVRTRSAGFYWTLKEYFPARAEGWMGALPSAKQTLVLKAKKGQDENNVNQSNLNTKRPFSAVNKNPSKFRKTQQESSPGGVKNAKSSFEVLVPEKPAKNILNSNDENMMIDDNKQEKIKPVKEITAPTFHESIGNLIKTTHSDSWRERQNFYDNIDFRALKNSEFNENDVKAFLYLAGFSLCYDAHHGVLRSILQSLLKFGNFFTSELQSFLRTSSFESTKEYLSFCNIQDDENLLLPTGLLGCILLHSRSTELSLAVAAKKFMHFIISHYPTDFLTQETLEQIKIINHSYNPSAMKGDDEEKNDEKLVFQMKGALTLLDEIIIPGRVAEETMKEIIPVLLCDVKSNMLNLGICSGISRSLQNLYSAQPITFSEFILRHEQAASLISSLQSLDITILTSEDIAVLSNLPNVQMNKMQEVDILSFQDILQIFENFDAEKYCLAIYSMVHAAANNSSQWFEYFPKYLQHTIKNLAVFTSNHHIQNRIEYHYLTIFGIKQLFSLLPTPLVLELVPLQPILSVLLETAFQFSDARGELARECFLEISKKLTSSGKFANYIPLLLASNLDSRNLRASCFVRLQVLKTILEWQDQKFLPSMLPKAITPLISCVANCSYDTAHLAVDCLRMFDGLSVNLSLFTKSLSPMYQSLVMKNC